MRIVPRTASIVGRRCLSQNSTGRLSETTKSAIRKGSITEDAARRPATTTTTHATTTRTRIGVPKSRIGSSGFAAMVRLRVYRREADEPPVRAGCGRDVRA